MNRTSPIWKLSKEEFTKLCKSSNSLADIIRYFKLQPDAGNYITIKKRIKEDNVNIDHIILGLNSNKGKRFFKRYKSKEEMVEAINNGKITDNSSIRNYIFRWKLLPVDRCSICGLKKNWNGKPLSFQMDHINGNTHYHHLSNIRFVCPNCHSQTETYSGKKTKNGIP